MRKKLFTLMTLLLTAVTGVWATDYTLTKTSGKDADSKTTFTVNGQAFVLDPAHGGAGQSGYGEYIKFSKNKTYTLTLPAGFRMTNINIKGYTNSNGKTNGEITSIGGVTQTGKTFPARDDASLASATQITNGYDFAISQTGGNVAIVTANTNQICVLITITGTATPRLTGAWSAASGTIYQGDDVPTPSFSVTNEPAPIASAYSVAYSLKAGSDDGVAEITGGGTGFTLNNSVVGAATIVATLTSTNTENYFDAAETYEYAYEVKAKTPAIELTEDEVTLKSTPVTRNASTTVDLTGAFLNDGTGSVTWTAVDGLTISPTSFDIASGAATETFTITYNKDVATSGSVDVTFSDGTTSKVLKVNYSSVVPHTWATVTESTTWDWTTVSNIVQLKDDGTTTPEKGQDLEYNAADYDGDINVLNAEWPVSFNAAALIMNKCEYPSRNGYYQGHILKFKTTKPGTVQIYYSSTGDKERSLYINGTKCGENTSSTTFINTTATVSSGIVVIEGMQPDGSATNYLHIQKIVFTANDALEEEAVAITCEGGLASYVNYDKDLDFSTSTAKAYIVTATSASSVTLTEVKKVARGTGIIIAGGAKGDVINVLTTDETTDNVTANRLKATAASTGTTVDANEAYGLSKADGKFHKLNAGTIPAGKAYLPATAFGDGAPEIADLDFNGNSDMTTGISTIEHSTSTIEHSAFYNLSGQRVSQPTKGLYIVNGKKVVIK